MGGTGSVSVTVWRSGVFAALAIAVGCGAAAGALAAGKPAGTPARTAALPLPAVPLTIENAKPVAVPPPPRMAVPQTPAPPRPFVAPQVAAVPAVPQIAATTPPPLKPVPVETPRVPDSFAATPAAPPPKPPPAQVAALPPPSAPPPAAPAEPLPAGPLSVEYGAADRQPPAAADSLLNLLAGQLQARPALRLQLRSYARATDDPRDARKLSLDRALALRDKLAALGIKTTRVDVRALGADPTAIGGPTDRIDIDLLNK